MTSVNVNETITFRRGRLRLKYLSIGGGLVAVGILVLLQIHKRETLYGAHDDGLTLAAWGAAALGVLCLLRGLQNLRSGRTVADPYVQGARHQHRWNDLCRF